MFIKTIIVYILKKKLNRDCLDEKNIDKKKSTLKRVWKDEDDETYVT